MLRRLIAPLLALLMTLMLASSASAWTWFYGEQHTWGSDNIYYCFEQSWFDNEARLTASRQTIEDWEDAVPGTITLTEVSPSSPSCNIHYRQTNFADKGWPTGNAGRTTMHGWNTFGFLEGATVYINTMHTDEMWFSRNLQPNYYGAPCYVDVQYDYKLGCADRFDFVTILLHETGHALGMGENTGSTLCVGGWPMDDVMLACSNDFKSNDVMYGQAGDGYRRAVRGDSKDFIDTYY